MALISPGVQVTVIDESNYIPAPTNSVPYFLIATAQDKVAGSGVGVAAGTLAANANKVYLITSQRDLSQTFGVPFFYKTTAGTPINGYELNEYGLLAAYSALGATNRAYVQRADVDLTELTGTLVRPTGTPTNGDWWFDTSTTLWGMFEWNVTTGTFANKVPAVITSASDLSGGVPSTSFGSIGSYAVDATNVANPIYYKNSDNDWVLVGSDAWKLSWPTVQGTNTVTGTLTPGWTININNQPVTVPSAPNNDLDGLVSDINSAPIQGIVAANVDNKLVIYADSSATNDGSTSDGQGIIYIDESSTSSLLTALGVSVGTYNTPYLQQSPNYTVPRWKSTDTEPRPTGSVWFKTNTPNLGANYSVKQWSSALASWISQTVTLYDSPIAATAALDPSGGGKNIPVNTVIGWYNYEPEENPTTMVEHQTQTVALLYRASTGPLTVTGAIENPTFTVGDQFTIATALPGSTSYTTAVTATIGGTGTAADFVAAVSAAGVSNVSASIDSAGYIVLTQSNGNTIKLADVGGDTALSDAGFTSALDGAYQDLSGALYFSNWYALDYTASNTQPTVLPPDGRLWYYSSVNQVDIMIQSGTGWVGYRNETNDVRGYNLSNTDPNGPLISASAPTEQSDATPLVYGDLWVDTSDLENYPVLRRWQAVDGVDQWVLIDNSDQTTENGILFADARWSTNGYTNPVTDNYPTIKSLLTSDYLDVDAPDSALYPAGMLLFNTRRSGYNVKSFQVNYFNAQSFDYATWESTTAYAVGDQVLFGTTLYVSIQAGTNQNPSTQTAYWQPLEVDTWVTASGNKADGSPYMGRQAQRIIVVNALQSGIDANTDIREEQRQFNLLACPNYPELIDNMIALNNDRNSTGFVVGDTPMRLAGNGTDIAAYAATNLSAGDPYAAVFWPSCQTVDLSGSPVVQPPSHMMVRTMIRNDEVAYPWLAPAGTRRGVIDNADNIGIINANTGEFVSLGVNQGLRDVLYENRINPITFVPGVGITNFGNKTTYALATALDRINVGRLVAFIRERLQSIGKNYLFEPNDQITRNEISNAVNSLMIDLVAKRGIYDFLVVCDDTNNTPARIDANELWIDIAIEPVKAVEFIYIPVRLKNTGEISAGIVAASQTI